MVERHILIVDVIAEVSIRFILDHPQQFPENLQISIALLLLLLLLLLLMWLWWLLLWVGGGRGRSDLRDPIRRGDGWGNERRDDEVLSRRRVPSTKGR